MNKTARHAVAGFAGKFVDWVWDGRPSFIEVPYFMAHTTPTLTVLGLILGHDVGEAMGRISPDLVRIILA